MTTSADVLARIQEALDESRRVLADFIPGGTAYELKGERHDPVTEADRRVNDVLHRTLLRPGEGWLSEESADDPGRLRCRDVWIVDPLDGTREFVEGIPEWVVSIGFVRDGRPIAGGMCNPQTGETFLGSLETGMSYGGSPARVSVAHQLAGATILASRSEVRRGEWQPFAGRGYTLQPMGSVAYKLGLVAAGRADATWTLTPKHEWDVAAGVALVLAGGGSVFLPDGAAPAFNAPKPWLPGLVACPRLLESAIRSEIRR